MNNFIIEEKTKISLTLKHEVLAITIDSNPIFFQSIKQLCKQVGSKRSALTRVIPYFYEKKSLLYNSFFKGQLSYCPLIWTFFSRRLNNLINKFEERALKRFCNDYNSSFNELFGMTNKNTIHQNIYKILTEIYKFANGLSPAIIREISKQKDY